jgi:hypothetical protein
MQPSHCACGLRDTQRRVPRNELDLAKGVADVYNRRDRDGSLAELSTPDFGWYSATVRAATTSMGLCATRVEPPVARLA